MKTFIFLALSSFAWAHAQTADLTFAKACTPKEEQITLALTGDVLVHDALYKQAVASPEHFYSLFKKTAPLFAKADFSYANLEGPVAMGIDGEGRDHGDIGFVYDLDVYSGTHFSFNYHPYLLADLHRLGLGIVSTANNHALDRGSIGVDRTIQALRKQGNLAFVGTRLSTERNAPRYTLTTVKGFQIAWVSCTEMTNGNLDHKDQIPYCYENGPELLATIKELSRRSDIDAVIVAPHWGEEYSPTANKDQKLYARKFLEAGATAVVGAHPHVLEPWEKYTTTDGRETLIVYSLGNFLAFQAGIEKKTGAILYLGLAKNSSGKAWLYGATYTPTYRDGFEVFPSRSPDVLAQAAKYYGSRALRFSEQKLWNESCQ